jgi:hypothetical protein
MEGTWRKSKVKSVSYKRPKSSYVGGNRKRKRANNWV